MSTGLRTVACCLSVLLSFASAQEITGTILGTVTDSSGAVVRGAKVTVTNVDRNSVIRTLTTNSSGAYVAPVLPIGHYSVSVSAPGFKTFTKTNLELNVSDRLSVNASLVPGSEAQTVNVEAEPLQVDTQSATATGLINGTQIRELALSARNYEELVALMPGVSSAISDTIYVGVETPSGGTNEVDFSINGNRFSQNNWTVDGADNVDRGGNFTLLNYPSVDAISEFRVLRGLYNPEYGRGAGGQINVITRSGTNRFHGNVYEFFRNDVLNANSYLNKHFEDPAQRLPRNPLRYNDFGGTIGGPVYIPGVYNVDKNRTFFFFSEEARRIVTETTSIATVPNLDERNGIFATPVCTVPTFDPNTGDCTGPTTTVINPASFNPAATAYIKDVFSKIPAPQDPVADQLTLTGKNRFNFRQEIIRIDHTLTPKILLTGRFINDSIPTINPAGLFGQSSIPGYATTDTDSPGRNLLVRGTVTLSTNLVTEGGYAWSYGAIKSTPIGLNTFKASPNVVSAITLPFPSTLERIPNLNFNSGSGYFGFGPYRDFNRDHNVFNNTTWVRGKHIFKFGGTYHWYQKNENDAGANPSNGQFTFFNVDPNGNATFQQEWANFLLGNVSNFTQTKLDFAAKIRQRTFEFYGQDEYRILPNLTLSYGLRYTYYGQPFDAEDRNTSFLPSAYDPAKAPQLDPTTGLIVSGTGTALNGVIISGQNSPFGRAVAQQPTNNFGPRIGLSWDPWAKGKTAIRAGFGIFYDSPAVGFVENNLFSNPPFVGNVSISNTIFNDPGSVTPDIDVNPQFLKGVDENWKLAYTEQWSFDVQQELAQGLLMDIGYYGSESHHLLGIVDINQPAAGAYLAAGIPGPIDASSTILLSVVRPFKGYGAINLSSSRFNANYHSLQASLLKRMKGGALVSLNYTWSHALTDAGNDFSTPQNNANLRSDYGPADFDRRHIFNANFVYPFPWLQAQQGVVGHLLGGWELSGIISASTGLYITPTGITIDPAGLGLLDPNTNAAARPDQIGDPNARAPHTADQWFNTSAFADPAPNSLVPGNARRGVIHGPGLQRWDLALLKNIRVNERAAFQFRMEAFNIFNHTNFQTIDAGLQSGTYGQVTDTHQPRIVQFGLKFSF